MSDIRTWLDELGLGQYADAFDENAIDQDLLPDLTDDALKEIGVQAVGHRMRIIKTVEAFDTPVAEQGSGQATGAARNLSVEPGSAREAERRQITIMFCDLVGSTALSEQLDPEDLRAVMQAYQQAAGVVIERYDGHIAQYLGDGLMTYFGWPRAHEDDAERAIRAGLDIIEAVKSVKAPEPLQVRVGIATGKVVVGKAGNDASLPDHAVGETPNLAARLESLAKPGQIVISPSTSRLIGRTFDLHDLGGHVLKGIVEPVRATQVMGIATTDDRFEAVRGFHLTPFIGRESEVAMLAERWAAARDGEGQVLLLYGEPGVGKSRTTQVLRESVAREPHTRLRYQCSPYHTSSALHPVIEQLERAAGFERDDDIEARLTKLERLVGTKGDTPALFASLLSLEVPDGRYAPLTMSPQKQKQETLRALADQVTLLSEAQPVLLIFEDAHWIDPTSQEMLDLLVPYIADKRVLLVVTYRPEYVPPWSEGQGHLSKVSLGRLGRKQAAALVNRVTDGKPLPDEVLRQILAKTDGIPLFVEELTKTVLEMGIEAATAIPPTLHDSLMARLDHLSPVKEVAQAGACIGREFSYALLSAVSTLRDSELDDALQRLVNSELIFRRGSPPDASYVFKHALVQDSAYQSMLRGRRQSLHKAIAEQLPAIEPTIAETEPELIAHHLTEAGLAGEALDYWLKAGELALNRSAMSEAITHLQTGLALLESLPESEYRTRQEFRFLVAIGPALMAKQGFAGADVGETYGRALAISKKLDDAPEIFPALYGMYIYHRIGGRISDAKALADSYLQRAEADGDTASQINAHRAMGLSLFDFGNFEESRFHLDRAIALYDPDEHIGLAFKYAQDPRIAALSLLCHSLAPLGYLDQAGASVAKAKELADVLGHPQTVVYAKTIGLAVHWHRREPERALAPAGDAFELAEQYGYPYFRNFAGAYLSWARICSGDVATGKDMFSHSMAGLRAIGAEGNRAMFLCILSDALVSMNLHEDAKPALSEALRIAAETGDGTVKSEILRLHGMATLKARGKDGSDEAESAFADALALARAQKAKLFELRAARDLARLWQREGKRAEAHELLFPVYDWFTEGFDTADLIEAKALLEELK